MAPKLMSDKYKLLYAGPYESRPPADSMPDECIYISTDPAHLGILSVKPGRGQDWIDIAVINADKVDWLDADAFARANHQHPLSDIMGDIAKGMFGIVYHADFATPTGTVYASRVGDIGIEGTKLEIIGLQVYLPGAPSESLNFSFYRNEELVGTVTVSAGQHVGVASASAELSPGNILKIVAPDDVKGAKGLAAHFIVRRIAVKF